MWYHEQSLRLPKRFSLHQQFPGYLCLLLNINNGHLTTMNEIHATVYVTLFHYEIAGKEDASLQVQLQLSGEIGVGFREEKVRVNVMTVKGTH